MKLLGQFVTYYSWLLLSNGWQIGEEKSGLIRNKKREALFKELFCGVHTITPTNDKAKISLKSRPRRERQPGIPCICAAPVLPIRKSFCSDTMSLHI